MMKNFLQRPLLILMMLGLLMPGAAQVKSDYDKTVDFSKFKSYKLEGWEKNSDQILTPFDKERIETALKHELQIRGMAEDPAAPDAAITLFIVVNKKTSTTAYTTYAGSMGYGYGRWGWGMGAGMGSSTTSFSEDDYLEGTFVVSMHDASTKDLAWQGVISSVVKEKPEKREKSIPKKMKKLFKSYPIKPMK
jgi:hypothetical protein